MYRGFSCARRIRGYSPSTSPAASTNDTPTSAGVCTPRYIREKAMTSASAVSPSRTHRRPPHRAIPPKSPMAFWVWPLGKEYPVASARALSTMVKLGSRTHGLGTRQISFRNWFSTVPQKATVIK